MKKRFLLLLPVLLIGIIAFVVSCVRNQDVYWDSPDLRSQRALTIADAQGWFEKEYSDDITVARSVQNGNSIRMVSYAQGVFAGSPDWATARPFRKNSNSLIVTLDYLNPKTNYRGFRDIIIVRNHKTRSFNAFVQLQLFDTTYLNNQKRIKGERAHIREYSDPATFTGKVYKYSINNEFIRGAIYKDGKMVARVFPKNKISSLFSSPSSSAAKKSYVPFNGVANLGRTPGTDVSKAVKIHSRSVVPSYEEPPVRMMYGGGDSTGTDEYDTNDPDSNMETVVVTAVGTGTGTQPDTDTCDPLWGDTCDGSGDDGGGDPYPTDPCSCGGGDSNNNPSTYQPPLPYYCTCSCEGADPDMVAATTIFEPRWGQLGSKADIVDEVKHVRLGEPQNSPYTLEYRFERQRNYFEGNRMWTRNAAGELVEAPGSAAINRYVYTTANGWIDIHHLFYAAYFAEKYDNGEDAIALTSMAEWIQWIRDNESAFSYEDKPSNQAGVEFWFAYKERLENGTMNMDQAIEDFLTSKNAKLPSEAPNYDYIPHVLDGNYPKNFSHKGLTGEELRQAAKDAYCKKTTTQQNNIKEAHQKLPASSPKKN